MEEPFQYLYAVSNGHGLVKIGRARDFKHRFRQLSNERKHELRLIRKIAMPVDSDYETLLHQIFKDKQKRGDWFRLDDDDVRKLNRIFNTLDSDGPMGLEAIDDLF